MRDDDQRAPGVIPEAAVARHDRRGWRLQSVNRGPSVKSAHSYCTPDHPPCACASCGDWIDEGGIYAVDSLRRPVCDACSKYVSFDSNVRGQGTRHLVEGTLDPLVGHHFL